MATDKGGGANQGGMGRFLIINFVVGLLGVAVGAGALAGYHYYTTGDAPPLLRTETAGDATEAPAEAAQEPAPQDQVTEEPVTEDERHATGDPRQSLIETVAYQVAIERGKEAPDEAIYAEVESTLERLEAQFPKSTARDFREAYRVIMPARMYFPDLTLDQIANMLVQNADEHQGQVVTAAHELSDQIKYEYFRPQIEAMQAQQEYEKQLNETIRRNLELARQRGEAANAERRASLAQMGRRTDLERRWFADYLASVEPLRTVRIPSVRPNRRLFWNPFR